MNTPDMSDHAKRKQRHVPDKHLVSMPPEDHDRGTHHTGRKKRVHTVEAILDIVGAPDGTPFGALTPMQVRMAERRLDEADIVADVAAGFDTHGGELIP